MLHTTFLWSGDPVRVYSCSTSLMADLAAFRQITIEVKDKGERHFRF